MKEGLTHQSILISIGPIKIRGDNVNIVGERVYFRAVELEDKELLLEMMNDEETEHNLGGWSFPTSNLNQEEWIRSIRNEANILRCIIVHKEEQLSLGTIILTDIDYKNGNAEIHIKLSKQVRSKGYGVESIRLLTCYAFEELRLHCIYAHVNSYNNASIKLFEKCGFSKEGILRDRIFKQGNYHGIYSYSLLKGD